MSENINQVITQSPLLAEKNKASNSKTKIWILLIAISFIIGMAVALSIVLLSQISTRNAGPSTPIDSNNNGENKDPEEDDDTNVIIIEDDESINYKYAAIKGDDTISVFDEFGRELKIDIEQRKWDSISWNEDGSRVVYIGKKTNDIYDLRIYFPDEKKVQWITDYAGQDGVNEYFWADSETIFFSQGKGVNNWLHRFFLPSGSERFKVSQIQGEILATSPAGNRVIYKVNDSVYRAYNLNGQEIWNMTNLVDADDKRIVFDNVFFVSDELVLLRDSKNNTLYKINFGERFGDVLINDSNITPLCGIDTNFILAYEVDGKAGKVVRLNTVTGNVSEVFSVDLEQYNIQDEMYCINAGQVIYSAIPRFETENRWYMHDSIKQIEQTFLKGVKNISIR